MTKPPPFKRGRVAISPHIKEAYPEAGQCRLHPGHARTLHLGRLKCEQLDIPYHVRLDADPDELGTDSSLLLFDLLALLEFLDIAPAKLYWAAAMRPSEHVLRRELGDVAARRIITLADEPPYSGPSYKHPGQYGARMLDDIVTWHPSFIIRGREFEDARRYLPLGKVIDAQATHPGLELALFAAAGHERSQWLVPMILLEGYKFSKGQGRTIPWRALTMLEPEVARQWLLATAVRPHDPLGAMQETLSIDDVQAEPYEWDWLHLRDVIKDSR